MEVIQHHAVHFRVVLDVLAGEVPATVPKIGVQTLSFAFFPTKRSVIALPSTLYSLMY
jgi:hypothetical protein